MCIRDSLNRLVKVPTDFGNALEKIPKKIRRMYIHAYQSYVFNSLLEYYIKNNLELPENFPLIGYNSELTGKIKEIVENILEKDELTLESFRLKRTPTLSEEGQHRNTFFKADNIKILKISDNYLKMSFVLPKGCYATSALAVLGRVL